MQVSLWSVIDRGYIRAGQSLIEATYVQVSLWSVIVRRYIRASKSMVSH